MEQDNERVQRTGDVMSAELFAAALRIVEDAPSMWMEVPRQIEIDGHRFASVTDGHALILIRDCDAAPMDLEPAPHVTTAGYIASLYTETYPNIDHVDLAEIIAWLGTGHECNCEFCGYESRSEPCLFYGQPFDRRVLRYALPRIGGTVAVEWSGKKASPIRVTGDGWIAVLMGLRDINGATKPVPVFDETMRAEVA